MSKAVQTRTAIQCHSHHQKMMAKHGSIDAIISHFKTLTAKRPRVVKNTAKKEANLQ